MNTVTVSKRDYLQGKLALKQMREVQKLLTESGVPDMVEVGDTIANGPQIRLKWFLLRRKDVSVRERQQSCDLTPADIAAINQLAVYGKEGA